MSEIIPAGEHRAKARNHGFGRTNNGDYQIGIRFELLDVPGRHLSYYGGFKDTQIKHTVNALRACGWAGDNLERLVEDGFGSQEVSLVVEHEEYNDQIRARVKWVNPSGISFRNAVEGQELAEFARAMSGFIRSQHPAQRAPAQQQANAAAQTAERVMNGGGYSGGSNYGTPPGGYGEPGGNDDIPF